MVTEACIEMCAYTLAQSLLCHLRAHKVNSTHMNKRTDFLVWNSILQWKESELLGEAAGSSTETWNGQDGVRIVFVVLESKNNSVLIGIYQRHRSQPKELQ